MISCIIINFFANTASKYRIYTASLQRVRGALTMRPRLSKRPHCVATASLQRAVEHAAQTPSHGVVFVHVKNDRRRMAF